MLLKFNVIYQGSSNVGQTTTIHFPYEEEEGTEQGLDAVIDRRVNDIFQANNIRVDAKRWDKFHALTVEYAGIIHEEAAIDEASLTQGEDNA